MSLKGVNAAPESQGVRIAVPETGMLDTKTDLDSRNSEQEMRLKHITLTPDHRVLSGNESSGVELCKKLFGITVFEYNNGKTKWNHISRNRKLVVQGVVEGSASHTSGKINRGDMLVRINDVSVSWHNFTSLLRSLNKRKSVKLTIQSPRIVGPKSSYNVLKVPDNDLCLAVCGKRLSDIQAELSSLSCVTLYLTLNNSSSEVERDEKEDVIYSFPPEEQKLTALRGLFITLSSVLVDVVNQPATCSSLVLSGSTVNVAYKQFGSDVLVFAMPENRISIAALTASLDAFCSLLTLMYTDVRRAFSECDRNWLDRVLAVMFYNALGCSSSSSSSLSHKLVLAVNDHHAVKMLNISHENKLICDEILSQFEAMDLDDYLDVKDLFARRQFTVSGTSLYYKDHLLCSHIHSEQQRKINLFMNCHGLLTLSSQQHVNQVMVWQEVKSCLSKDEAVLPAGYRPSQSRSFLMIMGSNHYYFVALIEDSDCSQLVQGQVYPIALLVDQVKATLALLETEELHISQYCEERIVNTSKTLSLASADKLCTLSSVRNRSSGQRTSGSWHPSDSRKQSLTPTKPVTKTSFFRSKSAERLDDRNDIGSTVIMRRQGSKLSYGSNDSAGSGSSAGPSKSKGSKVGSVADLSSIVRSNSFLQIDTPHDVIREGRLDRGRDTTLFNFVHLDSAEGILICPMEAEIMEVHSSLQQQILDNFSQTCLKMKALFHSKVYHSVTGTDRLKTSSIDTNQSMFNTSGAEEEQHYKEVGTLFCCTFQPSSDKRQVPSCYYWVVGRCWPSPRSQEIYVCFHESANQSLVEMAFTLGFGF